MYELVHYEDARGHIPFESELLQPLNESAKTNKRDKALLNTLIRRMKLLEQFGTRAGEDVTKQIEGNLWELIVSSKRAFFFMWKGNKLVILHAFTKKSQKTPRREIERAKAEMIDWLKRYGR